MNKPKAQPDRGWAGFIDGAGESGSRGSLGATLRRDGLSYFTHEEGLQVWLTSGPFQTNDRVTRLTRNEIAFSIGAGYFKFAGLAL
jgi:hypothetical protein